MAGTSLLTLLDDITALLDGVSALTKIAAKKTAGVLGDDLALNAEQVTGVQPSRELPVVWAVARGSIINKLILVPSALCLSAFVPIAITPLLMLGGAYLCFEGFEKVFHKLFHPKEVRLEQAAHTQAASDAAIDLVAFERDKVKGAVRTDFILSAEIIVITLGTLKGEPLGMQIATLVAIAALMTVGVYGLVDGIVKLDDAGLMLGRSPIAWRSSLGRLILRAAPWLMKTLSVAGTAAMFLVGGEILVHGVPPLHRAALALEGHALGGLASLLLSAVVGICAGAALVAAVTVGRRLLGRGRV